MKPGIDTKGEDLVVSRLGTSRQIDFSVAPEDDLRNIFLRKARELKERTGDDVHCLLVDEAQFLTAPQVDDLLRIAVLDDVPVLAYGIRTDFKTIAFPGSQRLLEIAHSVEELKTICRCGSKAIFNARKLGDEYIFDGGQIQIDDGTSFTYESLCGQCYLEESGGKLG